MQPRKIVRITGGPISGGRCGSQRFISYPHFREELFLITCTLDQDHVGDHEMHTGGSISGGPAWHMTISWPWEPAP